jgi:hypothetical protein
LSLQKPDEDSEKYKILHFRYRGIREELPYQSAIIPAQRRVPTTRRSRQSAIIPW